MDTQLLLSKLKSKDEALTSGEIDFLLAQGLAISQLIALAARAECTAEQSELAYDRALGPKLQVVYSVKSRKFFNIQNPTGEVIAEAIDFLWPENLHKEILVMEQLELDENLNLTCLRQMGKQFLVDEDGFAKISTDFHDDSFIAKRKSSFSFMKTAMMSTVLFAVLSNVAMPAFGSEAKASGDNSSKYEQQLDNNKNLNKHEVARLDAEMSQLNSSLNFLTDQLNPDEEASLLEKVGEQLHVQLKSAADLNSNQAHAHYQKLSSVEKGDVVLGIARLQELAGRKVFYHKEVAETFVDFDNILKVLESKSAALQQGQSTEDLQNIKNNNLISKVRAQADMSLLQKQKEYQAVKDAHAKFQLAQITFKIR